MNGAEQRKLWQRCQRKIRSLEFPVSADARVFCRNLARYRCRELKLYGWDLQGIQPGLNGLLISADAVDYILYERATSDLHQNHIILHEAAHLVWEHQPTQDCGPVLASNLFQELPVEFVQKVLGRAGYSSEHELEAEVFAMVVEEHWRVEPVLGSRESKTNADALIHRIELTLE